MCNEESQKIQGFCSCLEFGSASASERALLETYIPFIRSYLKRGPVLARVHFLQKKQIFVLLDFVTRQRKRFICDTDAEEVGAKKLAT